jgi:preprotein translocase subunit SecD
VTGFLEFKLVRDAAQTEELLLAKYDGELPKDSEIAFERDKETNRVLGAYLVGETPDLTGKYLKDARVGFDRQQRAIVQFQFNPAGGTIFQNLTGENIGERVAIVLDDQVYSAPAIRSRISTRGEITGRFTAQEAADLAVVLRAGSLAVPVAIEEERTVGPALGADSIQRGVRASILGLTIRCLRGSRAVGQPAAAGWRDVDVRGHAYAAGPGRRGADGGHGHRRQRDHLRADP